MGVRSGGRLLTLAVAGGASMLGASAAYAQSVAGTAQQLNPAARSEAARRARAADVFSGAPQALCSPELRRDQTSFVLRAVEVRGATRLTHQQLGDAYTDMIGKQVPVSAVCEIADRISGMLFARGLLARTFLPDQRISPTEGRVVIQVIEARIVSVRFRSVGNVGPVQAKVEAYLNKLRGLTPFDLDTAQHYLLLANDLPGVRVAAALSHSKSAAAGSGDTAGAVDLDVTITRRAVDAVAAVENTSSNTLGPWSGLARVDFNSFTKLGEQTSLIGYSTIGNSEQEVAQILEQARIGSTGAYVGAAFAYGWSRPGDVLAPLHLRGTSIVGTFEADYPLVRLRRTSLTLGAGMDFIEQKSEFQAGGVLSDDNLRVVWARATGSAQHEWTPTASGQFIATGQLTLDLRKGIDGLGSSHAGQPALSRIEGQPDAFVARADGLAGLHFEPAGRGLPVTLSVHFQGQWADKPLLAYEELPIGNLTIGQGYDPDTLSGDRVVGAEIKHQLGPVTIGRYLQVAPFGFYDVAYVSNLDAGAVNRTVRSVGGGAEFRVPRLHMRATVTYADPLDKTFSAPSAKKPPSRVLAQIIFAY
jgi:hemolysin activation/secretion protein